MLPEKYESNGWSAKFSTCVWSLRSTKSINGSPAISSAKRVQRAHWMQRSRSSRISSLRRIGFSQWRFSSTKRDSPGPNASVWSWSGHSPPRSQTGQSSGWLMSKNSRTPSWIFFTVSDCVWQTMPSVTGVVQAGGKPRTPSISTRHMRHMPTGCMRSCQQKRGMYTPCSCATLISSSPGCASMTLSSIVTVTVVFCGSVPAGCDSVVVIRPPRRRRSRAGPRSRHGSTC